MAEEAGPEHALSLPLCAGLLGAAAALIELLSFRLDAAVYGDAFARIVASAAPAFGAMVAAWASSRGRTLPGRADRSAAWVLSGYAAAIGGASCGATAIALTWGGAAFAKLDGSAAPLIATAAAWSLAAAGLCTAVAAMLRAQPERLGRLGFAFGVGGAAGALSMPAALWIGAPRALITVGLMPAVAALLLARAGAHARPRLSYLLTLPLALAVLLVGDLGSPWLRLRTDVGRRGRVGVSAWSDQGLIQIDAGKQGVIGYTVDRGPTLPLSLAEPNRRRQPFELADMAYFLRGGCQPGDPLCACSAPPCGPGSALIIGSGGGREVREALDSGYSPVLAIEPSAAIVRLIERDLGADSGHLLADRRVSLRIGVAPAQLPASDYERIIVVGDAGLSATPPQLVAGEQPLFTVDAVRAFLRRLAPKGALLLRLPRASLPDLWATARAAAPDVDQRAVACAERPAAGQVGLFIAAAPLSGPDLSAIELSCKRKGLTVELPLYEPHRGDKDAADRILAHDARTAVLAQGTPIGGDRPFYQRAPKPRAALAMAKQTLRALPARQEPKPKKGEAVPDPPRASRFGAALLAAFAALALLLLALPAPVGGPARIGLRLRGSLVLIGLATGLALVALDDQLLRWLGGADWAWPIVIPFSAAGLAIGRLLPDAVRDEALGRVAALTALFGAGLCGALSVLGPKLAIMAPRLPARLGGAFGVWLLAGVALGGALSAMLRIARRSSDAAVGWGWSAHLGALAFGAAAAEIGARAFGFARVLSCAALALLLGALLTPRRARLGSTG